MSLFWLIKNKYKRFKHQLHLFTNARKIEALQTNCEILEKHLAWFEKFHDGMGGDKLYLHGPEMETHEQDVIGFLRKRITVLMEQIDEVISRIRGMYVICVGEDLDAWNEYLRKRHIYQSNVKEVDWFQK